MFLGNAAAAASVAASLAANDTGKKKKKKKEKEKKGDEDEIVEKVVETPTKIVSLSSQPAQSTPTSSSSHSHSQSQSQLPQETHKSATKTHSHAPPVIASTPSMPVVIAPVIPASAPSATAHGDVVSRDDLLSYLLAMGFPESECLAAISSCGLNVDNAISWLCDRPTPAPAAPAKTKSNVESKETKKVASGKPPQPPSSSSSSSNTTSLNTSSSLSSSASSNTQELDAQLKLQKDKEHKEEQRRINRAWNARVPQQRAEEERKKV